MSVTVDDNNYNLGNELLYDRQIAPSSTDITYQDAGVDAAREEYRLLSNQGQPSRWSALVFIASQLAPQIEADGPYDTHIRRGARYPYPLVSATFGLLVNSPAFVSQVKPIPQGWDAEVCQPREGYLQITFDRQPEDSPDHARNLVLEEDWDGSTEFITLGNPELFWDDNSVPASKERVEGFDAPGRQLFTREYTFKRKYLSRVAPEVIALEGKVSDSSFTIPGVNETYAAGEVLCTKVKPEKVIQYDGTAVWHVQVTLKARAGFGWNKAIKAGTTSPATIYNGSGTVFNSFPPTSFAPISLLLDMGFEL